MGTTRRDFLKLSGLGIAVMAIPEAARASLLAEARDALGPDSVLLGNLEGPALATKPPEFILAECQRILADRAGDPHFILATSQADIPYNTPLDHIAAIRESLSGFRVVAS